jgi:hypothetical protein
MNDQVFNGTFWLSLAGVIAGIFGVIVGVVNKSKCKNVNCCCGVFSCVRDTEAEVEIEEHRIDHNIPESPLNKNVGTL